MTQFYPFAKEKLGYQCYELLPHFDPDTMYLHYENIYGRDVDTLNYLVSQYPSLSGLSLPELATADLKNIPLVTANRIRSNAGSVYNHNLYFCSMCSQRDAAPSGKLADTLKNRYGSLQMFQNVLFDAAHNICGSGWVWLNSERDGNVHIALTQNNDVPMLSSLTPLFNIDLWEHAYFLKYPTQIDLYLENWYATLDWDTVNARYIESLPAAGGQG